MNLPTVLVHSAFSSQLSVPLIHSLISEEGEESWRVIEMQRPFCKKNAFEVLARIGVGVRVNQCIVSVGNTGQPSIKTHLYMLFHPH